MNFWRSPLRTTTTIRDEGLELRPEFAEELEQRIADYEAGEAEMFTLEEVAKEFGVKLKLHVRVGLACRIGYAAFSSHCQGAAP